MTKWEKFEDNFCKFLEIFIEELGFTFIKKPERQEIGGPQYGRDISAEWHDGKYKYKWWFECKSHLKKGGNTINKREYADKVLEALADQHPPTCYCLVASERIFDKWFRRCQPLINTNIARSFIFAWTEKNYLRECLMFYPDLYKEIYEEEPDLKGKKKEKIFKEIKRQIIENNKKAPEKLRETIKETTIDKLTGITAIKEIELNEPVEDITKQLSQIKKKKHE